MALLASSEFGEVASGFRKTESSVGAAPDQVGVLIVLAIIFPEADVTDAVAASFWQRLVAAARACEHVAFPRVFGDIHVLLFSVQLVIGNSSS